MISRELGPIKWNYQSYKVLVQDNLHDPIIWDVDITVQTPDGWWLFMGKGKYKIGEIKDWIWSNSFLGKNGVTDRTPLHAQFKDEVEKLIVRGCLDKLNLP